VLSTPPSVRAHTHTGASGGAPGAAGGGGGLHHEWSRAAGECQCSAAAIYRVRARVLDLTVLQTVTLALAKDLRQHE
jgi:hypothetical protein